MKKTDVAPSKSSSPKTTGIGQRDQAKSPNALANSNSGYSPSDKDRDAQAKGSGQKQKGSTILSDRLASWRDQYQPKENDDDLESSWDKDEDLMPAELLLDSEKHTPQGDKKAVLGPGEIIDAKNEALMGLQRQKVWSYAKNAQLQREVDVLQQQLQQIEALEMSFNTSGAQGSGKLPGASNSGGNNANNQGYGWGNNQSTPSSSSQSKPKQESTPSRAQQNLFGGSNNGNNSSMQSSGNGPSGLGGGQGRGGGRRPRRRQEGQSQSSGGGNGGRGGGTFNASNSGNGYGSDDSKGSRGQGPRHRSGSHQSQEAWQDADKNNGNSNSNSGSVPPSQDGGKVNPNRVPRRRRQQQRQPTSNSQNSNNAETPPTQKGLKRISPPGSNNSNNNKGESPKQGSPSSLSGFPDENGRPVAGNIFRGSGGAETEKGLGLSEDDDNNSVSSLSKERKKRGKSVLKNANRRRRHTMDEALESSGGSGYDILTSNMATGGTSNSNSNSSINNAQDNVSDSFASGNAKKPSRRQQQGQGQQGQKVLDRVREESKEDSFSPSSSQSKAQTDNTKGKEISSNSNNGNNGNSVGGMKHKVPQKRVRRPNAGLSVGIPAYDSDNSQTSKGSVGSAAASAKKNDENDDAATGNGNGGGSDSNTNTGAAGRGARRHKTRGTSNKSNNSNKQREERARNDAAERAEKAKKEEEAHDELFTGSVWTRVLDDGWNEVDFLLRKPIVTEQDMQYTLTAAEAGIIFTDQLNSVAKSLGVLRGTLSRWLLPFDNNTRLDEQCSTPHSVVENMPDEFRGKLTERQVHYLVAGANSVRKLVRIKIADDNDLEQARQALKTTTEFFKKLQEASEKSDLTPFQLLDQRVTR